MPRVPSAEITVTTNLSEVGPRYWTTNHVHEPLEPSPTAVGIVTWRLQPATVVDI